MEITDFFNDNNTFKKGDFYETIIPLFKDYIILKIIRLHLLQDVFLNVNTNDSEWKRIDVQINDLWAQYRMVNNLSDEY